MTKIPLIPMIIWCETFEDLQECEKHTDIYFTEEEYDKDNPKLVFPVVYFRIKEHYDKHKNMLLGDYRSDNDIILYDYDLYECSISDTVEEFRETYYNKKAKEFNLTKIEPSEIPIKYPEYCI